MPQAGLDRFFKAEDRDVRDAHRKAEHEAYLKEHGTAEGSWEDVAAAQKAEYGAGYGAADGVGS